MGKLKKPINNGQTITKFCFKPPSQATTADAGPTSKAGAQQTSGGQSSGGAVKAPSKTSSSISCGSTGHPQRANSTASTVLRPPEPAAVRQARAASTAAASGPAASAAASTLAAKTAAARKPAAGQHTKKSKHKIGNIPQHNHKQKKPAQQKAAAHHASDKLRDSKSDVKASGAAMEQGAGRHETSTSAATSAANSNVVAATAVAKAATADFSAVPAHGVVCAGIGLCAAGVQKQSVPTNAAVAVPAGIQKSAKGSKSAGRLNRYGRTPQHGGQLLMSQLDEPMEVNWEPSPPKLQLIDGTMAAGAATAAAHADRSTPPAEGAAGGCSAVDDSKQKSASQASKRVQQLLKDDSQQHSGMSAAATTHAEAAAGSDDLLQQLIGDLSAVPTHNGSGASSAHLHHCSSVGLTTPGGPRLRAFRQHSIVPPPSTGGCSTGAGTGGAAPRRRPCSGAVGATAPGSSTIKRQQAGLKRKVLLDLLDKVEVMVKRKRGTDDDGQADGSPTMLDGAADLQLCEELMGQDADCREGGRICLQQQDVQTAQQRADLTAGSTAFSRLAQTGGEVQLQQQPHEFATPPPSQSCGALLKRQQYQLQQQKTRLGAAPVVGEASPADGSVDHVPETPMAGSITATDAAAEATPCTEQHLMDSSQACKPTAGINAELAGEPHAAAIAADSTDSVLTSPELRAIAAAKELEEFELLYGDIDDIAENTAPTTKQEAHADQPTSMQQQVDTATEAAKQQQQQELQPQQLQSPAEVEFPASKRQRLQRTEPGDASAGRVAPEVGLCGDREEVYHIVLEVVNEPADVRLRCFNPYKGTEAWAHLSHPWCDCPYSVGDAVNIIGGVTSTDSNGRTAVYLSDSQGMLILHPDILLSGTTITTALTCTRRAWLSERFAAAGGGPSAAALRGTLLHELLQRLLVEVVGDDSAPLPGVEHLQTMVDEVLATCGAQLQEVGLTEAAAAQEMGKHLANISGWLRKYLPHQQQQQQGCQQQPHQGAQQQQQPWQQQQRSWQQQQQQQRSWQQQQQQRPWQQQQQLEHWQQQQQHWQAGAALGGTVDVGHNSGFDQPPRVMIEGVADIEENISAPKYGLKGQLDASLLVRLTRQQQQEQGSGGGRSSGWGGSMSGQGSGVGLRGVFSNAGHGVLGSGWSDAGSGGHRDTGVHSGCGNVASAASRGSGYGALQFSSSNRPAGGQNQGQFQQQQQQQRHLTSGGYAGVLAPKDMNVGTTATASVQAGQQVTGATAVTGTCGVAAAAGSATEPHVDEPVKVFKGKLSGAAAAIQAVKKQQQHGLQHQQQQQAQVIVQQQPQPQSHVFSLASAPSRSGGVAHARTSSGMQQQQHYADESQLMVMPFEFKTGKEYFSHKAQVSLYLLLMEARYLLGHLPAGLLWNVHSQNMMLVPAKAGELASLLACRNRLAAHLWQDVPPPPRMLGNPDACARCHSAAVCAAVHAVVEGGTAASSGMNEEQWSTLLGPKGVSPTAAAWGAKWLQLIDWEESAARARKAEIWALTGAQRQAKGGCIAGLQLVCTHSTQAKSQGTEPLFTYTFKQLPTCSSACSSSLAAAAGTSTATEHPSSTSSSSSEEDQLQGMAVSPGDCLILSADGVQANVGRVDVVEVSGSTITVASRKALQLERYSSAAGGDRKQSCPAGQVSKAAPEASNSSMFAWRLDQDEAASTAMQQRANVLRVAADSSSSRVVWLRRLIIDLAPPKQLPGAATQPTQPDANGQAAAEDGASAAAVLSMEAGPSAGPAVRLAMAAGRAYLEQHGAKLNGDQVAVLRRILQMQDYSLVLGMPGTGKTSTIVHAIRALVASGASVLVTSYTNSALDNILLKLVECDVHEFVRLGRHSSCHPGVQDYMPGGARYPQQTTAELQHLAASTPIVGCPCLSVHHPLLATRPAFDVVIVDEAGQISLPALLGALLKARSFVLVGDHYQLPPLVLDKRASEGGLGVSLFRQLCEAHPSAMVVLAQQYRMCRAVQGLANELVYGGQLVAGSAAVESAVLQLPRPEALQQCSSWVAQLLAPECQLAFVNTDSVTPSSAVQDSITSGRSGVINAGEAALLMQLLDGLLACGVPGSDVGIVSPYKAQVTLLQQLVSARQNSSAAKHDTGSAAATDAAAGDARDVEVLTIDRCQGRDKPVLLLSFVRSNSTGAVGTLLSDWQRLNVAISRAKVKLILVGSARTLRGAVPLLAKLLDYVQKEGQLLTLSPDVLSQPQFSSNQ